MIYDYSDLTAGLRGVRLELATELDRIDTVLAMLEATSAKPTPTLVSEVMAKAEKAAPKKDKAPKANGITAEQARARWTEIVRYVLEQKAADTYSASALEAKYGSAAKNWKVRAAQYGIPLTLDEMPAPAPSAPAAPAVGRGKFQTLLACADCGETFAPDQVAKLHTHTIGVHGRRPTIDERRPVAA